MDRRDFLKCAGASAIVARVNVRGLFAAKRVRALKNWVWIGIDTGKSADDWKRSFATMRASGIHAIVPEIYNGRQAYFPSTQLPVKTDLLGTLLPLARAEGLEVHPWIWCMPCMVEEIMSKHPDWYNVNAKGESALDKPAYQQYYKFLDPGRPEVREWLQGIVKELAGIAELAGIHLDYIRYPDAILPKGLWKNYNIVQDKVHPQYDYGYTEFERAAYKKKHGLDPLQLTDPAAHKTWLQFRFDTVTDLVNHYLVPAAHARGKLITAAVFPGPALARQMVLQDWGRWKLDGFLPMLYNVFYEAGPEWVKQQTAEGVAAARKPVYSGLFIHQMDTTTLARTLEMAVEGGAAGVSLFSAAGMDQAKWETLRQFTTAH
jgi:uncharacterized lipoprotein YddW (UPF0748 family)